MIERVVGVQRDDLEQLKETLPPATRIWVEPSSIGVVASGPAFAIVVEIEHWATDAATVITIEAGL